eukprot:TRINITY_DN8626_c0_g2_i1.p1 TRINITY_DN8626_c0_g2~~TRINITY_DN8626_c0_g2_i1.p1  ORF type:complete len:157 (-),score=13.28 TRINITY_DN8626_c0_g2_i1:42-512(-)
MLSSTRFDSLLLLWWCVVGVVLCCSFVRVVEGSCPTSAPRYSIESVPTPCDSGNVTITVEPEASDYEITIDGSQSYTTSPIAFAVSPGESYTIRAFCTDNTTAQTSETLTFEDCDDSDHHQLWLGLGLGLGLPVVLAVLGTALVLTMLMPWARVPY